MSLSELATSRWGRTVGDLVPAGLWFWFAWRHLEKYLERGGLVTLVFVAAETLAVLLFLVRKPARTVAPNGLAWAIGIAGTAAPLLFTPTYVVVYEPLTAFAPFGAFLMVAGLASLNRSFGIVAANREIKTRGLYRVVRHPIYMSYVFLYTGYLFANWSPTNLAIFATLLAAIALRVIEEEKLLSQDPEYRAYMDRVRWRILPLVY